jgi:hypothetical protein
VQGERNEKTVYRALLRIDHTGVRVRRPCPRARQTGLSLRRHDQVLEQQHPLQVSAARRLHCFVDKNCIVSSTRNGGRHAYKVLSGFLIFNAGDDYAGLCQLRDQ